MFYRPGTEKDVTHRKGSILVDRTYVREEKDGIEVRDTVPEKEYLEIYRYLNGKQKGDLSESAKQWLDKVHYREAPCDIIKDKRYAQEKYFLHSYKLLSVPLCSKLDGCRISFCFIPFSLLPNDRYSRYLHTQYEAFWRYDA